MKKKTHTQKKQKTIAACFFSALQKKVLIPSMYFANYSKSKNLSVGKLCMKRFEFACMTILSRETVSIVLCQRSIMDSCKCRLFQISLRRLKFRPKRIQNALKTHIETTINKKNSRGKSPEPPYERGIPPLVLSPTRAFGTRSDFCRTTFK